MEVPKTNDLNGKLIFIIKKIIECKKFDSIYTEKFLVSFCKEFPNTYENILYVPEFSEWLSETFQKWQETTPNVSEAIFVCKFIGILTKNAQGFKFLLTCNAMTNLTNLLQPVAFSQTTLTPVYICFLTDILTHGIGYEWIKSTNQWKAVNKLYFSNSNLYVEREGLNFLKAFISKVLLDDEKGKEILQEIFQPLSKNNAVNIKGKKLCSITILFLKLLQSLLEPQIFSENTLVFIKLIEVFDVQSFINFLLENYEQEIILEELPVVIDSFYAMLKKKQFNGIIKVAKYCQVLWNEIRKEMEWNSKTEMGFIIVQLLPTLIFLKPDTVSRDLFIQKFFSLTSTRATKFFYSFSDGIKSIVSPKLKNLALEGLVSLISSKECTSFEEAVIIFQALAYMLNLLICNNSYQAESVNFDKSMKEISLYIQDTTLLSGVLNVLCAFIEKFKIKWSESLESSCLLKMSCILLENPNIAPLVVVKVFLLLKLAILNFTTSDSALLKKFTKDYSFGWLMSLLFKRLHDPNWEIRDSCLEIVAALAEMSESKCPDFEQLLVDKNLYSLVFDIMDGDSESYVRASAIQAMTAMLKVKTLKKFLITMDISQKIIKLLQNESEAIVRREAALMIKQIYLALSDPDDETIISIYGVMGYSALCDLHWEVKLNSLIFWQAVIQRITADQCMINEYFPKVTHSTEENEMKLRLLKVLTKLSETGCLHILLSTLNEDCDMPVIRKSAEILSELMAILERYKVIECFKDIPVSDRVPRKRKNPVLDSCEKKSTESLISRSGYDSRKINIASFNNKNSTSSDTVIDEIVNEMDINLLGVCFQKDQTVSTQKKILLQKVKPETFLLQMQNFNLEKFLEDKQKWLINIEVDWNSFLPETSTVNLTDETNVMDCY